MHKHQGVPPIAAGQTFQFPIAYATTKWESVAKSLDPLLGANVVATLKGLQQDTRRDADGIARLALLRDIDNDDKHQLVRELYCFIGDARFGDRTGRGFVSRPDLWLHEGRFDDGTEVARMTFRIASPEVDADCIPRFAIGFSHARHVMPKTGKPGHFSMTGAIKLLTEEVRDVVSIVRDAAV